MRDTGPKAEPSNEELQELVMDDEGGIIVPESEPDTETSGEFGAESPEDAETREGERRERVEAIKAEIPEEIIPAPVPTKQEIDAYVEKYLPKNFKNVSSLTNLHMAISRGMGAWWKMQGKFGVEHKDKIPEEGPMLIVANHYRFADETRVRAAMDRPTYVVGADIHFSGPAIKRWFLEKMGFIEVQSTLSNLNDDEKIKLLENVPAHEKAYYQKVVDRDKKPNLSAQRQFVRTIVALLAKGEPVTLFPEGLWLFDNGKPQKKMRQAYSGIEVIAREYKKVTGKELPLLPMVITDTGLDVLEPQVLETGETIHDVMRVIAEHLPEEERGFYKEA